MMQSESIANLAKALSIVQGKLTYAVKDSANFSVVEEPSSVINAM